MKYRSLNDHLKATFGCKVYKIAIDAGFTCPNRDGTIDTRGCIFCSESGSGEYAQDRTLSVTSQIEKGKELVSDKIRNGKFIAYFQAFTNTYAPVDRLRELYEEAISHPDVCAISVATRPDCLHEGVLDLISELNKIKPVWIELGLQTIHEKSAEYIRRGYRLEVYDDAVSRLGERGITTITHVILGLPGESREDMLKTVEYVGRSGAEGIKLHLLQILRGTDLEKEYMEGRVSTMTLDEYAQLVCDCIKQLPENIVIHRMTGDGAKKSLIAPKWCADKKKVLNTIRKAVEECR